MLKTKKHDIKYSQNKTEAERQTKDTFYIFEGNLLQG